MTPPTGQPSDYGAELIEAVRRINDKKNAEAAVTGQPSDADLARLITEARKRVELLRTDEYTVTAQIISDLCDVAEAAVRDRDARIAAARAEHYPETDDEYPERGPYCATCHPLLVSWPCPTIAALDGPL